MGNLIIANIRNYRDSQPQINIQNPKSIHNISLYRAIWDQNLIGWEKYLRGFHAKSWNIAHHTWHIEKRSKPLFHWWNYYGIGLVMNFHISIWEFRCKQTHENLLDPETEKLLHENILLLQDITNNPEKNMRKRHYITNHS